MNVLELFAGSRSIGKMCDRLGHKVFSSDINPFPGIDYVIDILDFDVEKVPFIPDFIWSSPPCTTYSIMGISHHRDGIIPISDFAKKSDFIVQKTIEIINYFLDKNPNLVFCIENPVGMLRKMPFMKPLHRVGVTYCSYGDIRMKPTDIWSNNIRSIFNPQGWNPRPKCYNNNKKCHHEPSPRGSSSGTQGIKGAYLRSKIPEQLCMEILESVYLHFTNSIHN